jgi:hypothetical protein
MMYGIRKPSKVRDSNADGIPHFVNEGSILKVGPELPRPLSRYCNNEKGFSPNERSFLDNLKYTLHIND